VSAPFALGDITDDGYDRGNTIKLNVADQNLNPEEDSVLSLALPFEGWKRA
jgi:hypothetical protein